MYSNGRSGEPAALESCYRRCFELAHAHGVRSIAFPSISTGAYGYPITEASIIALSTSLAQLRRFQDIDRVVFVLFSARDLDVYLSTLSGLKSA
jgi:O-acetyl-ADP-ribose deacetylase (regulator of RNase III)